MLARAWSSRSARDRTFEARPLDGFLIRPDSRRRADDGREDLRLVMLQVVTGRRDPPIGGGSGTGFEVVNPAVIRDGDRSNRVLLAPDEGRRDVAHPKRLKPRRLVQLALVKVPDKVVLDFRPVLVGEYRGEGGLLRRVEVRAVGLP